MIKYEIEWQDNVYTARPSALPFGKIRTFRKQLRKLSNDANVTGEEVEDFLFDSAELLVRDTRVNGEAMAIDDMPFPVMIAFLGGAKDFLAQIPNSQTPPINKG